MAQHGNDQFVDTGGANTNRQSMESDAAFHATPTIASSTSPKIGPNSTFMQNQISIQRSPSTVKEQASALSRKLSLKSNDSHGSNDANQGHLGIANVLSSIPQDDEQTGRGRIGGDSTSSIIEAENKGSLTKSSSERSSTKSVRSLHAVRIIFFPIFRDYPSPSSRVLSKRPKY
jgi:A1 cistron-splicing factor AAR2